MIEEIKASKKHYYKEMHGIADKLLELGFEYNETDLFVLGNMRAFICNFYMTLCLVSALPSEYSYQHYEYKDYSLAELIEKIEEHIPFASGTVHNYSGGELTQKTNALTLQELRIKLGAGFSGELPVYMQCPNCCLLIPVTDICQDKHNLYIYNKGLHDSKRKI